MFPKFLILTDKCIGFLLLLELLDFMLSQVLYLNIQFRPVMTSCYMFLLTQMHENEGVIQMFQIIITV